MVLFSIPKLKFAVHLFILNLIHLVSSVLGYLFLLILTLERGPVKKHPLFFACHATWYISSSCLRFFGRYFPTSLAIRLCSLMNKTCMLVVVRIRWRQRTRRGLIWKRDDEKEVVDCNRRRINLVRNGCSFTLSSPATKSAWVCGLN